MYETGTIRMRNTPEGIPPVLAYLRETAKLLGLEERESARIAYALEETLRNSVQYAFEADEEAYIEITISRVASGIEVVVADRGLPRDPFVKVPESFEELLEEAETPLPPDGDRAAAVSDFVLHRLLDRYRILNLGREGRRIEMTLYAQSARIHASAEEKATENPAEKDPFREIRLARPDDSVGIARLFYKSYGYTYVNDLVYYPQRLAERIAGGGLVCAVALSASGRIVGHIALMQPFEGAEIVEWGMAISDPDYRGQGIMGRLSDAIFAQADRSGKRAIFAHSVTNHAFTQKICQAHGFTDTALLLGYAGQDLSFRKIHRELRQRESTVISFHWLRPPETPPRLHLPARHAQRITELYAATGVPIEAASHAARPLPGPTHLTDTVVPTLNIAELLVPEIGEDFLRELERTTRRLCVAKVDILYLVLDLESSATPQAVEEAESLGYFFAGIFPGYHHPHALILQYVNNLAFDYDAIVTLSSEAERLKAYQRRHDPNQVA
jgi:anti-sigma regulatory factor (Ser/Thr protein kinase)/GNAT superfamily N-acetyltransferase